MKKIFLVVLVVFASFTVSCSKNDNAYTPPSQTLKNDTPVMGENFIEQPDELPQNKVSFVIKTSNISEITEYLEFEISNHTNIEYTYSEDFTLFIKSNDDWEYVEMLPGAGWNDIGIILTPYSVNNGTIDINHFFGSLSSGTYRIEKLLTSEDGMHLISSEFDTESVK